MRPLLLLLLVLLLGACGRVGPTAAITPTTAATVQPEATGPCPVRSPSPTAGTVMVTVVLLCGETALPVQRNVAAAPGTEPLVRAALEALLSGVTEEERAAGLTSWFSPETAGMLRSVTISLEGELSVDFADFSALIPNASSSAGSQLLLAQLGGTVFQFAEISTVTYQFEGSCAAFWEWLQRSCTVQQR